MTIQKSIGWVKHTINPIKGLCPEEYRCSYCYVPSFYQRFGWKTEPHLKLEMFENARRRRKPTRYFLCSTHDLFGAWVPKRWILDILWQVQLLPKHTFLILTKYPNRALSFNFPPNIWLGTSITKQVEITRLDSLAMLPVKCRFVSFEPLLSEISEIFPYRWRDIDWIIMGALTLPGGHTRQPEGEWVESLVKQADLYKVPVFMKDNLEWENRRREFPQQKGREG